MFKLHRVSTYRELKEALINIISRRPFKIPAPLGFLGNVDDTDLLREAFRRHDMV